MCEYTKDLQNYACFEFFWCLGKVFDDQKKYEQYSYNYGDGPEECATTGFGYFGW